MAKVTVYMAGGESWVSDGDAQSFLSENGELLIVETKHHSFRFPMMNVLYWYMDKEAVHPSAKLMGQLHTVAQHPEDPLPEVKEDEEYGD